ncbi:putative neutral ceramidase C [Oppia nitens]|uniref:putative neutral ceramidase C n=1 Tax=Oppia nitens TaxID=1686743 RepID=UPI0023DA45B8|nr:putative neutral ceramidase C [Oppia nitens]
MYNIPSLGFSKQNFDTIVNGIIRSIDRAHHSMTNTRIYINTGQLTDTSINRSPTAYMRNPVEERDRYGTNTDTNMTVLKMVSTSGQDLGAIVWFAVHCTSMNETNHLISSDNKGYASISFEKHMNGGTLVGKGPFVALFPNTNEGDVSPNTRGPRCVDTGLPCDAVSSTCNGDITKCIASGPGKDMFESTQIIGEQQYKKAKELYDSANQEIVGPIDYIHQTINMENIEVKLPNNRQQTVSTCKAAMGVSFAAGTIDGPGLFPFTQGVTANEFWNRISQNIIKTPKDLVDCQYPKPILLPTGYLKIPFPWEPSIVPTQIFRIGQLLIVSVPNEMTTMSGRRLRETVKNQYEKSSVNGTQVDVVISGLSNTYSSYVATFEEYQAQRYEGASTLYGPYTLDAYLQQYRKLAAYLAANKQSQLDAGPREPDYNDKQFTVIPEAMPDCVPPGRKFGDCLSQPRLQYISGQRVKVSFVSADPRNDVRSESTFLSVERLDPQNNQWILVATDANWETRFLWKRINNSFLSCESQATIIWDIPNDTLVGNYRIRHFGNYKDLTNKVFQFYGSTRNFRVMAN